MTSLTRQVETFLFHDEKASALKNRFKHFLRGSLFHIFKYKMQPTESVLHNNL